MADLVAVPREEVLSLRAWAKETLGLEPRQVMVSATHTHSGPATVQLNAAGRKDPAYMAHIQGWFREAARQAVGRLEECELVTAEVPLDVAVDRRKTPTAHTDPHALGLGFRRADDERRHQPGLRWRRQRRRAVDERLHGAVQPRIESGLALGLGGPVR